MASFVYRYGEARYRVGAFSWTGANIGAMLMATTYVPDQDSDQFMADITTHEITAGVSRISPIGSRSVLESGAATVQLLGEELVWPVVTTDCRYAVLYNDRANDFTSELFICIDFLTDRSPAGASVTVTPNGGSPGAWVQVDL